ncbi:MAG TPA: molybdopterin cofactor-binding domain-containing protein [Bryobacteraceae bacterium]|nr:molybdopterin cofactor-binding domain-containing protein [Bryobacteraceae bacterium]
MSLAKTTLEPERYELREGPAYNFSFDRRGFFKALGGGIVVVSFISKARGQESGGGRGRGGRNIPQEIAAWLHIDPNGAVTVYTGKVEVGQNARTSLTQAVAEELGAPLRSIELVMGDTERTPYDMGTFGSMTTPQMVPQLRKAAAAARAMLPAGPWESIHFAEIAKNGTLVKGVTGAGKPKPAADWKVMGTSVPKVHGREMVTGKHRYTSDVKLQEMLYGRVLRPEKFDATLVSLDSSAAKNIAGVTVVHDGEFAGVAAPTPHAAAAAMGALKAEWKSQPQTSSKTLFSDLLQPVEGDRRQANETGSIEKGLADAAHKLESTYTVAYIAHAPLEPRAAVAEWIGDKLTVWTGTQRPFGVQSELAQAFHIPEQNIRVFMPDTGSGYGGKHTGEAAIEAARLAKAAGKPVKLVWTREEEFTWAYFRPAGVIRVRSGVDRNGRVTAWEFHNYNSGTSGINTLYDIPNRKIGFHASKYPLRQGSYRGLAATANHFAREVHMDELATAAGVEPLEFRLRNLTDERFKAVLRAAADRFEWGKRKAEAGTGFGIAGGFEKGSYVAACAEIRCESGKPPRVVRMVESFECGAVVNPDHLKNQVEGSIVQGLGGALFEAVDFEDGKILNPRFSKYRVPRFHDTPEIDVVLVDRKDLPSAGAGETPIVTVAPAIANAIFAATGERLRSLPLMGTSPTRPAASGAAI